MALLSFDIYDGLPVQRLPLQRAGQAGNADADGDEPDGARPTHLRGALQARLLLRHNPRTRDTERMLITSACKLLADVSYCLYFLGVNVLKPVFVTLGPPDADGVVNGDASTDGNLLTGFENLEEVLSPETAAASKQAATAAANGGHPDDDVAAPAAGVSLLGGLVTAKSKASRGCRPLAVIMP